MVANNYARAMQSCVNPSGLDHRLQEGIICEPQPLSIMAFATASVLRSSALEKAEVIAAQFDYSDDEIRTCVGKFRLQLGLYTQSLDKPFLIALNHHADEGLRERTPAMCQIPTYVTRVAKGTEKVNVTCNLD